MTVQSQRILVSLGLIASVIVSCGESITMRKATSADVPSSADTLPEDSVSTDGSEPADVLLSDDTRASNDTTAAEDVESSTDSSAGEDVVTENDAAAAKDVAPVDDTATTSDSVTVDDTGSTDDAGAVDAAPCVSGLDPDDPCTVCTCDANGVKTCKAVNVGTSCILDNCCEINGQCTPCPDGLASCPPSKMICQGQSAKNCDDNNICTSDSANCEDGKCNCSNVSDPTKNGKACVADETQCTTGDLCTDGVCVAGDKITVDDGIDCTVDACKDGKVTHTPDNMLCDDKDGCTSDTCVAGTGCENIEVDGCGDGYVLDTSDVVNSIKAGSCSGLEKIIDCAKGSVAVGYEGQSGAWLDHIQLHCRVLKADGSLGNKTVTGPLGASNKGNEFGVKICPKNMMMVGSITKAGNNIDSVQGMCHPPAAIVAKAGNYTELAAKVGGSGGSKKQQPCPPGYVVTGMAGPQKTYPCRLLWRCTALKGLIQ